MNDEVCDLQVPISAPIAAKLESVQVGLGGWIHQRHECVRLFGQIMSSGGDSQLKVVLQDVVKGSTSLIDKSLSDLATAFSPQADRSDKSTAYLILTKLVDNCAKGYDTDDARTQALVDIFWPYAQSTLSTYDEDSDPDELLRPTSLLGALFTIAPAVGAQILTAPLSPDSQEDTLTMLLEASELQSPLQVCFAEMLALASVTKPGRDCIRSRTLDWLHGAVEFEHDPDLQGLCAAVLSNISQEPVMPGADADPAVTDDSLLCDKLMSSVIQSKSIDVLLPVLQGLVFLSLRPSVKERLSRDAAFIKALLALSPIPTARSGSLPTRPRGDIDFDLAMPETRLCYGLTLILVNLTSKKALMSAEDEQIARMRALALRGKGATLEEDPLDSDQEVRIRIKRVLEAGVIPALRGLVRADGQLGAESLGRLCLNLVEDKSDRLPFIRDGGFRVLSSVLRKLVTDPTDSQKPSDVLPAAQALAKLVITTPPNLLFPPPHLTTSLNALAPLYRLLLASSSLQRFEALMALTNLASIDESIADRIVTASIKNPIDGTMFHGTGRDDETKVVSKVEEMLLDDNKMVRRAAVELVCNLVASPPGAALFGGSRPRTKSRLNVLLALSNVDDPPTRRAAIGALAMLSDSPETCAILIGDQKSIWSRVAGMFEPELTEYDEESGEAIPTISSQSPDEGMVHRVLVVLENLLRYVETLTSDERDPPPPAIIDSALKAKLEELRLKLPGSEIAGMIPECLALIARITARCVRDDQHATHALLKPH